MATGRPLTTICVRLNASFDCPADLDGSTRPKTTLPAGAVTLPFTIRLVSSCAANFFPALSPEETGSSVRTDNTVPLGTVEASPGSGVSNAQRLKERAMKYFVMNFMREFTDLIEEPALPCGNPNSVWFPVLVSTFYRIQVGALKTQEFRKDTGLVL
jgi:hypothetical protein